MRQAAIAIVIAGFGLLALALLFRRSPGSGEEVPPALRPGDTDDVLESERLTRIIRAGVALSVFFAFFLAVYWFAEPGKRLAKEKEFEEESIARGASYYALRTDPVTGEENLAGIECARCHGINGEGGENDYLDPATGVKRRVQVPELQTIFARYEDPPPGYADARAFIRETIERGRPGTDMPTWGNQYGGPLTEQQIDDILNWMETIQKSPEVEQGATGDQIFAQFCASCHGMSGTGGSGPAMVGGSEVRQFPTIDDHIAFVLEGSKAGQRYGTSGMGTGAMPGWRSILSDEQIRLVVEYERSL